ncbi:MFS transporter, DHA3 family, macrolide efflux protein [Lampropedia hyalina DSM 16112]|jgi:DHA3 family macrolide efflux protein-like MFS transporter|uniref:Multidrug efflux pump Tap n=1 Tax=Lampropedia hyalina DSM 16112 TaxID=1122156 RepID=A0A1M4ZER0_9BURK|nr:MFS transporter [Lampropedia hyalina]SHF16287.1 MFS transporter, DHA3 family, macrolide efflux protein [Lampropedia hyalina DSM 16112]
MHTIPSSADTDRDNDGHASDPGRHWQLRYWSIFSGQALSLIGSALTQFVLLWWITDTTGSVASLATAGLAALLPQALLGPIGGICADRYSRRLLMIGADLISALCMLVLITLFLTDSVQLWHLYVMMAVRSAMQAFQTPAASASTVMLVPRSFLPRAAGLNQTLMGLMTVVAAPLGALAIGIMPIGWALGIDVATAILGIVPLLLFRIPQPKVPQEQRGSFLMELRAGVRFISDDRGLLRLYGLLGMVILIIMPSFTLLPLLVKAHFGGGPTQVAIIEGLGGAGMIAGGMLVAALAPRRQMRWVLWGFALSCLTLAFSAWAPAHMFWLAVLWWSISCVAFIMGNAPLTALLQTIVPPHLQGRVLSLLGTIMGLAAPIGLALATPLGEWIGIRWLFVLMGVLGGIVSLLGLWSPTMMGLDERARHAAPPVR